MKYDTRACEVLQQCKNARMINVFRDHSLIVFPEFTISDRCLLRGFLASLLWRMSVTQQKEFAAVNIGEQYEDRIAKDILHDGSFPYVDALVARYETLLNFRMETPQRDRIKGINVYWVKLPFLNMIVSLDKRKKTVFSDAICISGEFLSFQPRYQEQMRIYHLGSPLRLRLWEISKIASR